MAEPLAWMITLFDKMSGPATKISKSLGWLDTSMHATEKSTATLEKAQLAEAVASRKQALELPRLQMELSKLDKELSGVGETTRAGFMSGAESGLTKLSSGLNVAGAVLRVVGRVAHGVVDALGEIGANQATQGIFEDLLGKSEGGAILDWLGKIQMKTAFTRDTLEELTQPLAEFFSGDQLKAVLVAGLDVGRGSIERTHAALEALTKVASTGKISGKSFKTLGLTASNEFKNLKGGDAGEASITVNRLLQLMAAKTGGKLGSRSEQAGGTMAAALEHFRGIPGALFEALSSSDVLPRITAAINSLTASLTSPRLIEGLTKLIERMSAGLPGLIERVSKAISEVDWIAVADGLQSILGLIGRFASIKPIDKDSAVDWLRFTPQALIGRGVASIFSGSDETPAKGGAVESANDFVYRSNGSILKINSSDDIMGFKPGGPIASGGGGASIGDITINVSGGGNGESIAQSIRDELRNLFAEYGIASGVS